MRKKRSTSQKIISFITFIIAICVLIYVYGIYKTKNLNDFVRAEQNLYTSSFSRDFDISTDEKGSYKIESNTFNDAMFFKEMEVQPNTAYKVSCKVKTDEVIKKDTNISGGAHISIDGTMERSKLIAGTQDWTDLTLYFNSGNNTTVDIGFRLGGYDNECTGTAWFDDIKLEKGIVDTSTEWDFVCFIFKNLHVELNGQNYNISMNKNDINQMKNGMERFETALENFSKGKIRVNYEVIEIDEPLTNLSYDEENAYYVRPENVSGILDKYLEQKEYDHIFAAVKLGDLSQNIEIPVNDWIGLGGLNYENMGFSDIRLPNSESSYMYKYVVGVNEFPEEVFVHEFLHTLERNAKELGCERPELHDYEKFGYKNERVIGLKKWYIDYMNHEIKGENGQTYGLDAAVYAYKPVHESDFEYSIEIDIENEPENIIEEIRGLFANIINLLQHITQNI